jgi:ATP-binding cassette, subfamily B, bacterial HlyB/CyaB
MTSVDAQIDSFISEFFEAWPFNHLPAKLRGQVASKLRLCSFRPGDLIHASKELPSAVHCVVQERVRLLGPTSYQSPTLAVVGDGAVVGWDSLLRRVSVGSVRAAITVAEDQPPEQLADVLTLALPADEFELLAVQHLMTVLTERISLIELFDTLSRFLSTMPTRFSEVSLKDLVQYIDREQLAVAKHWHPTMSSGHSRHAMAPLELTADRIWLVSGGEYLNIPIGTPVGAANQLNPHRPSLFPVRLLGIDRAFLSSAILSGAIPKLPALPGSGFNRPLLPGNSSIDAPADSSIDPDAPIDTSLDRDPSISAPSLLFPPSPAAAPRPALPADRSANAYSIWRSPEANAVEDVVACFGMICDRLQVPYRPDSLRRWLTKNSTAHIEPYDLYLRIAQAIGLSAELIRFTPTGGGLNRLATPALLRCHDIPAILHEVSPKVAIVGSPRTGLLRLTPDQLANRLSPDTDTFDRFSPACQAIVFERLPHTPLKHFGFHWFIGALSKQQGILMQVLIASMFVQLLGLANPLLVQQVIDNVIINASVGAMPMFGMLMIVFAMLEGGLTVLRTYLLSSTTNRLDLRLGIEIVRHLLHLPMNFFEKRPVGELSSRLSELENIRQFLTGTALTAILDVVFSIFYIAVMFLYSPRLTLCVLLTVPLVVLSTLIVSAIQRKLIRLKSDHGSKVQSYLVEVLGGIFTVKAQHIESLVEATWRERYVQYLASGFKTSTVSATFGSFSHFLNTTSSLLVLWVGAEAVLKGELTLGGLIAFRILTGYVTGPLLRLARLWQRFQETSLSMELLADIVEFPAEETPQSSTRMQLPPIDGRVQYHEVSFGFKPGQLQLSNVSLDIPAGSFVGIVGQSGSGKSTLMKLLPRLYTAQTGSISIDGYEVSKVNLGSLRSQIGIVPQDAVLFEGTIRDNIALFTNLSDEEVIEAAKIAEAHDFIMQLSDGYSTQVGERGGSLSGGQRQRIAIARVVARNPRLLIFDEATSALDYETERRVCENLMQKFHDRTCFFITHRLNTIVQADWILFMQAGIIAEQGTHHDLMSRRQLYYCLYTQQARM